MPENKGEVPIQALHSGYTWTVTQPFLRIHQRNPTCILWVRSLKYAQLSFESTGRGNQLSYKTIKTSQNYFLHKHQGKGRKLRATPSSCCTTLVLPRCHHNHLCHSVAATPQGEASWKKYWFLSWNRTSLNELRKDYNSILKTYLQIYIYISIYLYIYISIIYTYKNVVYISPGCLHIRYCLYTSCVSELGWKEDKAVHSRWMKKMNLPKDQRKLSAHTHTHWL